MTDVAVRVQGLSKDYVISHRDTGMTTLAEVVLGRLRHPFHRQQRESFRALSELNFEVREGDIVGVVGRNGAGKSTLLKVLARITAPTEGRVDVFGRVGSLLEVGTGFHPELSGRENVFLNGAVLGMTTREVRREFDAIVDFAGVERFLDTPVKRYSSGMYIRLAFAVAAHLDADVLLVDEVLAVGDVQFQEKCLGKMRDVASGGRSVLFVSHQMQSVAALCNRVLVLSSGMLDFDGDVSNAIDRYLASYGGSDEHVGDPSARPGTGEARVRSVHSKAPAYLPHEPKEVTIEVSVDEVSAETFGLSLALVAPSGVVIAECDSRHFGMSIDCRSTRHVRFRWTLRSPWLHPGRYRLDLRLMRIGPLVDEFEGAVCFDVVDVLPYPAAVPTDVGLAGVALGDFDFEAL